MLIPKEFAGLEDLESMLLTSLLGTLVALKEDLISFKQAQNYWFSDMTVELFEALNLSSEITILVRECVLLGDLTDFSSLYKDKLDELISQCKSITATHYTEYPSDNTNPIVLN